MPTDYMCPADDRPRFVDWNAGTDDTGLPIELRWWLPTVVPHGGRDATVVIDSKGEMAIFHDKERAGTVAAPYSPHAPYGDDFWPVVSHPSEALPGPALSHLVRDTGWMVAQVGDEIGLASSSQSGSADAMLWRLALAFVQLGFYPPLGLDWEGWEAEFRTGVATVGDRDARRIKRALLGRLTHDRRQLRQAADRIETYWRT